MMTLQNCCSTLSEDSNFCNANAHKQKVVCKKFFSFLHQIMESDKVSTFYSILYAYRGTVSKRNCEDELYRERKVYNVWVEIGEKLNAHWKAFSNLFYTFLLPQRSLTLSLERIIPKIAFCPPTNSYLFNFDLSQAEQSTRCIQGSGELLLTQFATSLRRSLIKSYQAKLSDVMSQVECFYAFNRYGNRVACMLIHGPPEGGLLQLPDKQQQQLVIVYSHTNAEDIGTTFLHLWRLRRALCLPIFTYDYSGFGLSSGSPSERNLYADIEAAVEELGRRTSFKPENMVLLGESIGSVATVHLASKMADLHGVILQSAFLSGVRIYFNYPGPTMQCDPFPNIDRAPLIRAKTLVIHGSEDTLVDISHAVKLVRALPNAAVPFWANGYAHMNIHKHVHYYDRIRYFLLVELVVAPSSGI